jgi:hypothetical protein
VSLVSGDFNQWGHAGRGKFFTVWYNGGHVWIELNIPHVRADRFDTSPHGSGGSGPRLRYTHRSHAGFAARHFPGL